MQYGKRQKTWFYDHFLHFKLNLYLQACVGVPTTETTCDQKDGEMVRWGFWEAASKQVAGKSRLRGEDIAGCLTHCIMHNVCSSGRCNVFPTSPASPLNWSSYWVTERGLSCQGQRRTTVGKETAEEEDQGGQGLLQEEDWGQAAAEECERVCRSMKNIFGYKKSNSRQSENMPSRVSLVSLEEVGGEKRWWPHYQPSWTTPLTPPAWIPKCPGQLLRWQAAP